MSLNSVLFTIAENHINNDFYGNSEIRRTFLHKRQMIDVVITLTENGKIHGKPEKMKKNSMYIWVPLSLEASSRGNGHIYPFALHEQVRYLSRSFEYNRDKECNEYYDAYMNQLKDWADVCSKPVLKAVIRYLESRDIIYCCAPLGLTCA